jgi:N-[(2S)-2-amino-2-carboxyethyl]-L-glutamate dehydrogenase
MRDGDILILKGNEVVSLLANREADLVNIVQAAYLAHGSGESSLPHSTFLRFPHDAGSRIIALPAYLGGDFSIAGIKWVASFPGNLERGIDRASAIIILNSAETGRPEAIMEASVINAKRTAASAASAAMHLLTDKHESVLGLLGCGPINFEVARFVLAVLPQIKTLVVSDIDGKRAAQFKEKCLNTFSRVQVDVVKDTAALLASSSLQSFATTAAAPHISDLSGVASGGTILHISLRDLAPEVILSCDNIADDIDHVCRAQTSVHLAEQLVGNRDFIRCTLADIVRGTAPARRNENSIAVFSPFGLGVLDMAVGQFVRSLALDQNRGTPISSFVADPWAETGGAQRR